MKPAKMTDFWRMSIAGKLPDGIQRELRIRCTDNLSLE